MECTDASVRKERAEGGSLPYLWDPLTYSGWIPAAVTTSRHCGIS